jgi:hypothetical protein
MYKHNVGGIKYSIKCYGILNECCGIRLYYLYIFYWRKFVVAVQEFSRVMLCYIMLSNMKFIVNILLLSSLMGRKYVYLHTYTHSVSKLGLLNVVKGEKLVCSGSVTSNIHCCIIIHIYIYIYIFNIFCSDLWRI